MFLLVHGRQFLDIFVFRKHINIKHWILRWEDGTLPGCQYCFLLVVDLELPGISAGDLFGMVKWPFQMVKWPPTRGWQGHKESLGRWWFQIFYFHPDPWKWSNLTSIFFKWVQTTNQIIFHLPLLHPKLKLRLLGETHCNHNHSLNLSPVDCSGNIPFHQQP